MNLDATALRCLLDVTSSDNLIFVLTGGANSGKTTLLRELGKQDFGTIDEQATKIIETTGDSIRSDIDQFVRQIWSQQFRDETNFRRSGQATFSDRGIYDQLAYYMIEGKRMPADLQSAFDAVDAKRPVYKTAFVLETLSDWRPNGIRDAESLEFSKRFCKIVMQAYQDHGTPVVYVPLMPPSDRLQFVLRTVANVLRN